MASHTVNLDDEHIIFLTETIGAMHLFFMMKKVDSNNFFEFCFADNIEETCEHFLKNLLRDPLKDPTFRQKINHHFEHHPSEVMQKVVWPLLELSLIWED